MSVSVAMPVHVEKDVSLCGLSLKTTVLVCTAAQACVTAFFGCVFRVLLGPSVIVSILLVIQFFCAAMAILFLAFILAGRKFGSAYEVLLHAYLLSILLMGLTALFCLMFLPLSFLQQTHSIGEGLHYLALTGCVGGALALQFFQKGLVEQMLPFMEHSFQ